MRSDQELIQSLVSNVTAEEKGAVTYKCARLLAEILLDVRRELVELNSLIKKNSNADV
jgi:hypothetical protein